MGSYLDSGLYLLMLFAGIFLVARLPDILHGRSDAKVKIQEEKTQQLRLQLEIEQVKKQ